MKNSVKYDIFISYSRKDIKEVTQFVDMLKMQIPGITYWFDLTGIESGDEFEDKIISAISNSSYVLFMMSESSMHSQWTKDEVMYARNIGKKVIPIILRGANITEGWFLFKFGRIDSIDISDESQVDKLMCNLSAWTNKPLVPVQALIVDEEIPLVVNYNETKTSEVQASSSNNGKSWLKWAVALVVLLGLGLFGFNSYRQKQLDKEQFLIAQTDSLRAVHQKDSIAMANEIKRNRRAAEKARLEEEKMAEQKRLEEEMAAKEATQSAEVASKKASARAAVETAKQKRLADEKAKKEAAQRRMAEQKRIAEENSKNVKTFTVNGVSFEMIRVKGGTFSMGAQATSSTVQNYDSDARAVESPVHKVTLSEYYIGRFEVTQELWKAVMEKNKSKAKGDNLPAGNVNWNDCQKFIKELNTLTGKNFSLPTEAQWEFAARGGVKSKGYRYCGSNNFDDVGWCKENSSSKCQPVGSKSPNELGIYDMTGNVWEWCQDWHGDYTSDSQTNPTGAQSGTMHVLRGGSYRSSDAACRVSARGFNTPTKGFFSYGLRLVLVP